MESRAREKLFKKAFEEASGGDPYKAGTQLYNAASNLGVFDEEKSQIAKRLQKLGSKFGLKNLKQSSDSFETNEKPSNDSSVLEEISIGNEDINKKNNKKENPLNIDLTLDNVGIQKNVNLGDFTLGAKVNQPFDGDTEFGITGSGEIFPNVNLNVDLNNKNQLIESRFNKRF